MAYQKYIPMTSGGLPVLRADQIVPQNGPQKRPISKNLASLVTGPIKKDQSTSLSQQQTGGQQLLTKHQEAIDPNEMIKALLQLQELSPPGLRKQKKLVQAMEDGLGGILGSFKDSPASAMDLSPVMRLLDESFGTKLAKGYKPTTHNIAMNIPKYAELAAKERSKYTAQEHQYLNKILSDFEQQTDKVSTTDAATYRRGIQDSAKRGGLTPSQKSNIDFKISDRAGEFVKDNVDYMTLTSFDKLDKMFSKYKDQPSPLNRSEAMNKIATGGYAVGEFFGMDLDQVEKEVQRDRETMQAAYELLTGKISMLINKGALSEEDINRANRAMGRNWTTGGDETRREILKDLRKSWENSFEKRFDTLDPRVKKYLQKRGTHRSFFKKKTKESAKDTDGIDELIGD